MTKQQKTYALLAAVLIIWGLIGYQFYTNLNSTSEVPTIIKKRQNFVPKMVKEQEQYTINATYRDPFLGKRYIYKKKRVVAPKKQPLVPFPSIIYNGVIEGNGTKAYILTIDGNQIILKRRQTKQQVTLVKGTSKQVTIRFQKRTKTISLQQ